MKKTLKSMVVVGTLVSTTAAVTGHPFVICDIHKKQIQLPDMEGDPAGAS